MSIPSTSRSQSHPPSPKAIRLFNPALPSKTLTSKRLPDQGGPSLREAYESHVRPALVAEEIKPRTIEEDRQAITKWETRTVDPGVAGSNPVGLVFFVFLAAGFGLRPSRGTCNNSGAKRIKAVAGPPQL
jgi:hypothetical protein